MPPPVKSEVKEDPSLEDEMEVYSYPQGDKILDNPVFCPSCGVRVAKHAKKTGKRNGVPVRLIVCPDSKKE